MKCRKMTCPANIWTKTDDILIDVEAGIKDS